MERRRKAVPEKICNPSFSRVKQSKVESKKLKVKKVKNKKKLLTSNFKLYTFNCTSGLTLVETLIAVTITATMSVVIASTLLSGQSYYGHEKNRIRNEAQAMEAITLMEKTIRTANNFTIYDNKTDQNPVTLGGTYIELLDIKGTASDTSDDETIEFWLNGNTCYYNSVYPSVYGTKTKELGKHFNSLAFSEDAMRVIIDFQIEVPRGVIDYFTSAMLRN